MAFFNFIAREEDAGQRVDTFLVTQLPQYSRAFLKKCRIAIGGAEAKLSTKLKTSDAIQLAVPALKNSEILPEDIPLEILFEDADILVVNKKAGMVVHPSDHGGHVTGTLVNALLFYLGNVRDTEGVQFKQFEQFERDKNLRPGLVHRLDRDTSGVMVIAKTEDAKTSLTKQFADRSTEKCYTTIVAGIIREPRGRIDAPIGRDPADRTRRAISTAEGSRPAVSEFEVVTTFQKPVPMSLLRVQILTGRTHQIRVHLKSIGHPVMGDTLYGSDKQVGLAGLTRQFLHAASLTVTHPKSGERMTFTAALPADLEGIIADLDQKNSAR